jgi:hypothetical protein
LVLAFCFRLNEFLEFADDLAIDVPKFWPYIAEVIGKCVQVGWATVAILSEPYAETKL